MSEVTYYTQEGLDKLKEELHQLKTAGRASISKAIAEARDKGDLSENAEYDAAKEAQGLHEAKIAKLETTLSTARLIDESKLDLSKVLALSIVKIKNVKKIRLACAKQKIKPIFVSDKALLQRLRV